jgi:hypothetical protein
MCASLGRVRRPEEWRVEMATDAHRVIVLIRRSFFVQQKLGENHMIFARAATVRRWSCERNPKQIREGEDCNWECRIYQVRGDHAEWRSTKW